MIGLNKEAIPEEPNLFHKKEKSNTLVNSHHYLLLYRNGLSVESNLATWTRIQYEWGNGYFFCKYFQPAM